MEIKTHYTSFSEAIREGAKLRPHGRFYLLQDGATCAFGAGLDAMGYPLTDAEKDCNKLLRGYGFAEDIYPYLTNKIPTCPACEQGDDTLTNMIWHLNDIHDWTREAIADWLETEEEKLGYVTVIDNELSLEIQNVGREVLALT